MHCYCIYCTTQKCNYVAEALTAMGIGRAITPKILQRKWIGGKAHEEIHEYLPGYVFLYTETPPADFSQIRTMTDVHRLLGNKDDRYELCGADRAFAEMLYASDGTIGFFPAYEQGDRVRLDSSLLEGVEGVITRLDRAKKRAEIEFDFDGKKQRVWCGIELIASGRKDDVRKK